MLVEIDAQIGRPAGDVVATDGGGETLLFELLFHARHRQAMNSFGPEPGDGRDEPGQFIASVKRFVQWRDGGGSRADNRREI